MRRFFKFTEWNAFMAQVLEILKVLVPHFVRNHVQETVSLTRTIHFLSEIDEYSKLPLSPNPSTSLFPPCWLSGSVRREWVPDRRHCTKIASREQLRNVLSEIIFLFFLVGRKRRKTGKDRKVKFSAIFSKDKFYELTQRNVCCTCGPTSPNCPHHCPPQSSEERAWDQGFPMMSRAPSFCFLSLHILL